MCDSEGIAQVITSRNPRSVLQGLVAFGLAMLAAATLAARLISDLHGYQVTPVLSATLAP